MFSTKRISPTRATKELTDRRSALSPCGEAFDVYLETQLAPLIDEGDAGIFDDS
jgi:hypothetical protein